MSEWSVKFGRGWHDAMPPEVQRVLQMHQNHDKLAVLCVHADTNLPGGEMSGDVCLYDKNITTGIEAMSLSFSSIEMFISCTYMDDIDNLSIIFMNFKPLIFDLSPRPSSLVCDCTSVLEGLRMFSGTVQSSIRGEGMWSTCEWAMLSCSR